MNATAQLSNYRQSPRKVRLLTNLLKGKPVAHALVELEHYPKRAAPALIKLIKSAIANAKASGMDTKNLLIKEFRVDKGVVLKRSMPRAHGRAFPIHKHTSHVKLVLAEKEEKKEEKAREVKETKTTESKVVAKKPVKKTKK